MWNRIIRSMGAILFIGLMSLQALACADGPTGPSTFLESDWALLRAPDLEFAREINRLFPDAPLAWHLRAIVSEDPVKQSRDVDVDELDEALRAMRLPVARVQTIRKAYTEIRDRLASLSTMGYVAADWMSLSEAARDGRPWRLTRASQPEKLGGRVTIPSGMPDEFADYITGAVAWHRGEAAKARAAWERLLARPPEARQRRSVWAAFMLGKSWLYDDPAGAVVWFGKCRELAAAGFSDRLGLASSSLGWQARAELHQLHFERAIDLYFAQAISGDDTAINSLSHIASHIIQSRPDLLPRLVHHANTRKVLLAWCISSRSRWDRIDLEDAQTGDKLLDPVLAAIEGEQLTAVEGAERIAWFSYRIGRFEKAERWLGRATPADPLTPWLTAKLLLRKGRTEEAIPLLRRAADLFDKDEQWESDSPTGTWAAGDRSTLLPRRQVIGELAAALVAQARYIEALRLQLDSDIRDDAAYLMECVLTVEELEQFVSKAFPVAVSRPKVRNEEDHDPPAESTAEFAHHTLGRRLARLGRIDEARRWIDPDLVPFAERYLKAMASGRDSRLSNAERAAALWEAARALAGSSLMELRHDSGYYVLHDRDDTLVQVRRESAGLRALPPSTDERNRLGRLPPQYDRVRFRLYMATDLAWEAAQLMPDESEETAEMLCEAGRWLPNCECERADRFFKALARRCSTTRLGTSAIALNWFPPGNATGRVHPGFRAADRYGARLRGVLSLLRGHMTHVLLAAGGLAVLCVALVARRRMCTT